MSTPLPSDPAVAAFGASLTAITLAELGDKTFFMALIPPLPAKLTPLQNDHSNNQGA